MKDVSKTEDPLGECPGKTHIKTGLDMTVWEQP